MQKISKSSKDVKFVFIPSHVGIYGNEKADTAAKKATEGSVLEDILLASDYKNLINRRFKELWEEKWISTTGNKYREIRSSTKRWSCINMLKRRDSVVLTRLRMGHTNLTHSFLMSHENAPICDHCKEILSVQHIFNTCMKYETLRREIKIPSIAALNDDLSNVNRVIKFMKQSNIYDSI